MILDKIIESKKEEVDHHKRRHSLADVKSKSADCEGTTSLVASLNQGGIRIIAEIKRESPSGGPLRPDLDPEALAKDYEKAGAAGISVLTDRLFFKGSLADLRVVRQAVALPLLRKDFMIDPYQVYEARVHGADAILLIARVLAPNQLEDLMALAKELGMEALVEVHSQKEWESVCHITLSLLGINNRDLDALKTDLKTTLDLAPTIPQETLIVSESGINSPKDISHLQQRAGVTRFLIGEALLKEENPAKKLQEFLETSS
jgi:indole-3-glycerol phosphate synthase